MMTGQLERRFSGGWFARGAYSYGRSNSISDTTNSTARSTWLNVYTPGNINDAPLAVSNFDLAPPRRPEQLVQPSTSARRRSRSRCTTAARPAGPIRQLRHRRSTATAAHVNDLLYYPRETRSPFRERASRIRISSTSSKPANCDGLAAGTDRRAELLPAALSSTRWTSAQRSTCRSGGSGRSSRSMC